MSSNTRSSHRLFGLPLALLSLISTLSLSPPLFLLPSFLCGRCLFMTVYISRQYCKIVHVIYYLYRFIRNGSFQIATLNYRIQGYIEKRCRQTVSLSHPCIEFELFGFSLLQWVLLLRIVSLTFWPTFLIFAVFPVPPYTLTVLLSSIFIFTLP